MPLEKQVCSLELAKKLKELGQKQESLFYWYSLDTADTPQTFDISYGNNTTMFGVPIQEKIFAFTVAELGEMLPEEISDMREQEYWVNMSRGMGGCWVAGYRKNGTEGVYFLHSAETEADARAKMLIYLLENNLIEK